MKKTLFLISFVISCILLTADLSAQNNQALIQQVYQEEDNTLEILCAVPGEKGSRKNIEVFLDGSRLEVDSVTTLRQEPVPRTIYCLADISGSMKGRMEQVKEVLYTLCDGLKDGDNLVIGKMGNKITDSKLMKDQKEIYAQIGSLEPVGEDTDLYSGIIHGLDYLLQGQEVHTMKALVILSDGFDDQGDGSTYREAYDKVEKSDIPVFTVAPILSADDYENAKELGSFARNSPGGIYLPASDDGGSRPAPMTGKEMGLQILKELGKILHVKAGLEDFPDDGESSSLRLSVSFQSENGKVYRDSRELWREELKLAEPEPEPIPEPDPKPEIIIKQGNIIGRKKEQEPKQKWAGAIAALALAAAVLIGGFVLAVWRKKRQSEEKERLGQKEQIDQKGSRNQGKSSCQEESRNQEKSSHVQENQIHPKACNMHKEGQESRRNVPRLAVRLSAIGQREKRIVIELAEEYEITVGRNQKAQMILDAQDVKLSGVHFVMYWNGKNVYVWDNRSKNGTSVNGVVINELGRVVVRPGDSLRAGSYEYRLDWEER